MILFYWLAAGIAAQAPVAPPRAVEMTAQSGQTIDSVTTADELTISPDAADRMTVLVSVAGRGPYRFLVDTGSERTVISRELAGQLQLAKGRSAVLHSVVGVNDVATVNIPHLRVSSNIISVNNAPALKASNIGADGMLGIDSLRSQRVLFDFKANTMSITPAEAPLVKVEGDTIVVRARMRNGRLIFTQAKVAGRKVTVIVDTGSQVSIANQSLHRMLAKRGLVDVPESVTIHSVTGEQLTARATSLPELDIGGVRLQDLNVAFADAHIFRQLGLEDRPAMLLGMNAMRAFDRISIDFASKKVRFVLPGTSMRNAYRLAAVGGH